MNIYLGQTSLPLLLSTIITLIRHTLSNMLRYDRFSLLIHKRRAYRRKNRQRTLTNLKRSLRSFRSFDSFPLRNSPSKNDHWEREKIDI